MYQHFRSAYIVLVLETVDIVVLMTLNYRAVVNSYEAYIFIFSGGFKWFWFFL